MKNLSISFTALFFIIVSLGIREANSSTEFINEGPMTFSYWSLEQFETYDDYVAGWDGWSANELDVNGVAYLSWYNHGAIYSYPKYQNGNYPTAGDSIITRFTYPGGSRYIEAGLVWKSGCWRTLKNQEGSCFYFTERGFFVLLSEVGDWVYQVLVNNEEIYREDYHVFGYTLENHGQTSVSGGVGTTVKQPLSVKLVGYDGVSGVPGEPVSFTINGSWGARLVSSYTNPSSGSGSVSKTVTTDSQGIATVYVELGNVEESFTVTASATSAPIDPPYFTTLPAFPVSAIADYKPEYELTDADEKKNQGLVDKNKGDCVANPINISNGNKFQRETDLAGLSASKLEFVRYYNSKDLDSSSMGVGWRHNFYRSIEFVKEGKGKNASTTAFLHRPDGKVFIFVGSDAGWVSDADIYYELRKAGGKWELLTPEDAVELYDGNGNLVSITDIRGNTQALSYDNQKRLTHVTTNSNEEVLFAYNADGYLVNTTYWASNSDPTEKQARQWTYAYADGKLTSVTNPDGTQRLYHYEDIYNPWSLTGITDERGERYATWAYDLFGYATTSYHGIDAERVDIGYGLSGVRTVTDSLGNVTEYVTTAQIGQALVVNREGPACATGDTNSRAYDFDPATNNKLSATIDGTVTQYGNYDSNGNPCFMIEAVGTPSERRMDYTYDPRFQARITSITEPSVFAGELKVSTMAYDDFGNLIRRTVDGFTPEGTPVSRISTFEYNGPYGQLSQIDGPRTDATDISTFQYYADDPGLYQHQGMLRKVTGPEGIVLRDNLQYNAFRQLISETRPNGLELTYLWEPHTDRLSSLTETVGTESRTTAWTYLPTGEIETITQADGSQLIFEYDQARRLTRVTDALGNTIDYSLDTEGNIIGESSYDPSGALKRTITRSFDVYNRFDVVTQANESIDYDYAADGTLAKVTNGKTVETQYGYDALKRLTTTVADATGIDPATAASQTDLGYDSQDNLTAVTDPKTSQTTYDYDDLGNLVTLASPDTGTTRFNHDGAGNRTQLIDAKGQVFTYHYDALNRLTFFDAPGTADDVSYTYDSCTNGTTQLCSLTRGANHVQYAYNGFGEQTALNQDVDTGAAVLNTSLGVSYDAAGRPQTLTYPGGAQVTYGYDAMGNVNELTLDRGGLITTLASNITYLPFGPVNNLDLGNGLSKIIDYDQAYRLSAINDPAYNVAIDYDANGNIIYQSRNVGDMSAGYDALDKLTTATVALDSYDYSYDRNANRLSDTLNGATTLYDYEPFSNRMSLAGSNPVVLDDNGNTLVLRDLSLSYSSDNRLIAANDADYAYNGLGERVLKNTPTATRVYHYDPQGRLIAELNGGGQVEKVYIHFNNQPFAVIDYSNNPQGELYYIHNDHLGTPQALTNEAATVVWQAHYSPFGKAVVNQDPDLDSNPVVLNLRFPGQYFDEESGLHYNYFRDYDPRTGRYVESDPIGLAGGLNTYAYVGGNPISRIDPLGLYQMCHRDLQARIPYARHCYARFDDGSTSSFALNGVNPDPDPNQSGTTCTNPKEPEKDDCIKKAMQRCKGSNYNLTTFNCCHCVEQALKECGTSIPPSSWPNWPINPGPQPGEPGYSPNPTYGPELGK